ncbi:MAG: hypothetical protein ACOVNZ_05110, partial [Crocinitomicaceae bacterium]
MKELPDIIKCNRNNFLFKKVRKDDIHLIWESAPLEELFKVLGRDCLNVNDLADTMQLDWTIWYFSIDEKGHSYGLLRVVPEMDLTYSLHGIGWIQKNKYPRVFVLSWYAFHHYLFNKGIDVLRTYCDSSNINAIRFDIKTGYVYEYCMPALVNNKIILHLKLVKENFYLLLARKSFYFEL